MNPTLSLFPDAPPAAQPPAQERGMLQVAVNLVLRLDFPGATMDHTIGPDGSPTLAVSKETEARLQELVGRLLAMDKKEVVIATGFEDPSPPVTATLHGPRVVGMHLSPELPLQDAPTVADPLEPQTL